MIEFLNNPWTIGIGGGLISGIVVFLITSKIFSRKENKEYVQKIKMANKELLYSIRPLIVQEQLPTVEMMDSLLLATAKKYGLQLNDMYDEEDIADDLIKETLENPFINSQSKQKYCELANKLKILGIEDIEEEEEARKEIIYINKEKTISKEFFSLTLAMVSMMAVLVSVFAAYRKDDTLLGTKEPLDTIGLILTMTLIPIIALTLTRVLKIVKEKEKTQKAKSDDSEPKGKMDENSNDKN